MSTTPNQEAPIHRGFSKTQLDAAFAGVANRQDWKAQIAAVVEASALAATLAAIEFFTATTAKAEVIQNSGRYFVTSAGYRMGPAGDH